MGENAQLIELYAEIENPIENPETIVRLLDDYSKSKEGGFYNRIIASKSKKYSNQDEYANKNYSDFYTTLTNIWKKSVIDMPYDRFIELAHQGVYRADFRVMRDTLQDMPDFVSQEKIEKKLKIADDKTADHNGFARTLNEYMWKDSVKEETGTIKISSTDIHASKPEVKEGEYRLYVNPEPIDLFTLLIGFVKECEERNLPYDFEYNTNGITDLPVVIKATDDTIKDYIDVLRVVYDRYPEMKARMNKPPVIAGSIDGWIGYGIAKDEEYLVSRANLIEESIKEYTLDWILNNKDIVDMEGIKLVDRITFYCTEELINEMGDIDSESKERLKEYVKEKMDKFLVSIRNKEEVEYRDPVLDIGLINRVLRKLTYSFSKLDPNFSKGVTDKIYEKAIENGIDPYKFCLNYNQESYNLEQPLEEYDLPLNIEDEYDIPDDEEPKLTDGTEEAEIIDFDDPVKETQNNAQEEYETVTDTSDKDISNKIDEINEKPIVREKVILYEEYDPPKPKEEKTIFEDVMEEIYEEQRKQDEIDKMPLTNEEELVETEISNDSITEEPQDSITIAELDVKLPNGNTITLSDYYNNYFKLNKPLNATIALTDGKSISAKEFMQYIILPSIGTEVLEKSNSKPKLM